MAECLIIGNGVAGTAAAESIRKNDKAGDITIVTDEDFPFYSRIRLPEYVSGEITEQELMVKKEHWYKEMDIDLRLRTRITGADMGAKVVITEDNKRLSYDRLLIATGSHSFIPPIKGSEKNGVFSLRNIRDARDIIAHAGDIESAVLIGGGLLGLEAGNAFRKLGKQVTVVEFFPRLLPRQLDVDGAKMLQSTMEGMGFSFRLGAKTEEIEGDDLVSAVRLEGGETLPAKMVIISAGVRPNMVLAGPLGLEFDKGIKVDERLMTNRPDIYAAGDVAEYKGIPYGIWPAAMDQGKTAGVNMAGGDMIYNGTTMANTLKVAGIDLASAGEIDAEGKYESRVVANKNIYKKIIIDNGQVIGCIMLGDTKGFNKITKAMSEKKDVSGIKDQILSEGFDFNSI
ncbi:NAD(P)/FAD-dependent oxidoreductase [Thermodesulfobacteriota bacterium]